MTFRFFVVEKKWFNKLRDRRDVKEQELARLVKNETSRPFKYFGEATKLAGAGDKVVSVLVSS